MNDSAIYFWEAITGVINDKNAKILRLAAFVTLFMGILWSAWNFYQAIYGTNENYLKAQQAKAQRETQELRDIAEAAEKIKAKKIEGLFLAEALSSMNRQLFNIDGFNDFTTQNPNTSIELNHKINVRAIMVSDKNQIAVVDVDNERGLIVRKGQDLPDGAGRVVKIKLNGLTVKNPITKQETEYLIK